MLFLYVFFTKKIKRIENRYLDNKYMICSVSICCSLFGSVEKKPKKQWVEREL